VLKNPSLVAVVAVFSALEVASASAMPLASATQASAAAKQTIGSDLILVAEGCGIGFHRGPYGGCQPKFEPLLAVSLGPDSLGPTSDLPLDCRGAALNDGRCVGAWKGAPPVDSVFWQRISLGT
jgi:hypothetical protein